MRIGIFVLAAGRTAGGPETYEVELIRSLARIDSRNQYFIYCTSPAAAAAVAVPNENFVRRVLQPPLRILAVAATLPRWMARDGIDFFHSTYAPPPAPGRPYLFTMHCFSNFAHPEFYPALIRWRLNALQRMALRRARSILCVSDFVAGCLRDRFRIPSERLRTVYNGVSSAFHSMEEGEARRRVESQFALDGPYLLYVGKLQARKNVVGLLHAYARYRKETRSAAKLVLAGKKMQTSEGIEEAIDALGIRRDVVFLGHLPHPSASPDSPLPHLYAAARMTVFPSFYEGFGIPLVEAMAAGCPVVASNRTSLPEIAGDAALLADPDSTEELASAMAALDSGEDLRRRMIERGLSRARLFTWENCARQTLEAYREIGRA